MESPYQPIEAIIEDIVVETPTIKTFQLRPKGNITFQTGQFVELTVPGVGEAPFTPSSSPYDRETLELTIMDVGRVTSELHNKMKPRDMVGIRGPYGIGYPVDRFKGKEVLIVGGGVGLAPLKSLLLFLFANIDLYKRVLLRYGARTPTDILYRRHFDKWERKDKVDVLVTVDKGDNIWTGNVGLVTTLLNNLDVNIRESVAIVCGPPIMIKFVTFKLLEIGYYPQDIYLSMEKNMSCGIGKCGHCRLGRFYVCKDGPVFRYDDIDDVPDIWE